MGQTVSIEEVADKVQAAVDEGHAHVFVPTMFVMNGSLCSGEEVKTSFRESRRVAGIRSNIVRVQFPDELRNGRPIHSVVYETVDQALRETANLDKKEHWFFVYHPDDKWHDDFAALVKDQQLNERFCGLADEIDTVIQFMRKARRLITRIEAKKDNRPVKLHLLIPTDRHLVIEDAIKFPNDLGDFVVEAPGRGLVQLSIPEEQRSKVRGIACYMGDARHRELGTAQ